MWRGRRPLHRGVRLVPIVIAVLVAGGCAAGAVIALTASSEPLSGIIGPGPLVGTRYSIAVWPYLQAGEAGWCVSETVQTPRQRAIAGEGCGPETPNDPLVAGGGRPGFGWAIVTSRAAAVRFGPGRVVAARSAPGLPAGLKSAVTFNPATYTTSPLPPLGKRVRKGPGLAPIKLIVGPVALDQLGRPIRAGRPDYAVLSTAYWQPPQPPPDLPCTIRARELAGVTPEWGNVITHITPVRGLPASALLACADTEFYWGHSPLQAAVLINPLGPTLPAASLPSLSPVDGQPGLFTSTGGAQGRLTAKRIGHAWLVVQGYVQNQRIALLRAITVRPIR